MIVIVRCPLCQGIMVRGRDKKFYCMNDQCANSRGTS